MKTITFSGADRDKWVRAASIAGWEQVISRSSAHGANLKALFTK